VFENLRQVLATNDKPGHAFVSTASHATTETPSFPDYDSHHHQDTNLNYFLWSTILETI